MPLGTVTLILALVVGLGRNRKKEAQGIPASDTRVLPAFISIR